MDVELASKNKRSERETCATKRKLTDNYPWTGSFQETLLIVEEAHAFDIDKM